MTTQDGTSNSDSRETVRNPLFDASQMEREVDNDMAERHKQSTEDPDTILDEIDEVLEEHSKEFVRSYAGKGGQGYTDYLTPEFIAHVVITAVAGHTLYDTMKTSLRSTIRSLRKNLEGVSPSTRRPIPREGLPLPEGSIWELTKEDGSFKDQRDEDLVREYFRSVARIQLDDLPRHDQQEADAVHAIMCLRQLLGRAHWVQLPAEQYQALHAAGQRKQGAKLTAEQMTAEIVGAWLARNPNATIGSFTL